MLITILSNLNEYAKNNVIISSLILSIIATFIYDILKEVSYLFIVTLARKANKWSQKKIEVLIKFNQAELERVEKMKNKEVAELFNLIETLYSNLFFLVFVFVFYFLISKVVNEKWLYIMVYGGWYPIFQTIVNTYYNYNLMLKSQKFESYKIKTNKKILKLQTLIS